MDLRRLLAIIRTWYPLLVASVVLAAGAAFLVSSLLPKTYEARATLIVGQSLSAVNPDYNQLLVSQQLTATYAAVATMRPNVEAVITQLGLNVSPDDLLKRVQVQGPAGSTLLTISAQDTEPARAAAIANALAQQLIAASPAIQGRQPDVDSAIDADLKATQVQITATQERVTVLSNLPNPSPAETTELATLEGRLASLRSTYATLLSFSSANASTLLSVVEPADPPAAPVSPRPLLNTLLAGLLGLLASGGVMLVAEYLDDSIKDPDTVQEVLGVSTLGAIEPMKGGNDRMEIYRLAALLYPRSGVAEAYRTLRTNIEFASVDAPIRTLLITSSVPGEGKTITAANLAIVFAQAGRRVLLVDADLRRPGVHVAFSTPNDRGLTTMLHDDDVDLTSLALPTEEANLRILTSGPLPPNPAELMGSQRMQTVLERLKAGGDVVIFDSPPLHAVSDAAILSSFLDGTIFVIDAGRSRRGTVRQGREALAKAGARVLGVVLNRRSVRVHATYPGYGEDYGGYVTSTDASNRRALGGTEPPPGSVH